MEFQMLAILLVFLFARTTLSISDLKADDLYSKADDLFESIVGDVKENRKEIDPPKTFSEMDEVLLAEMETEIDYIKIINDTHGRMRVYIDNDPTSTSTQLAISTTARMPNVTIDVLKTRMRKIQLNQLLETHVSPMPNFNNGSDDPDHITRRFQGIVRNARRERKPGPITQSYFYVDDAERLWKEKVRIMILMEHFIYAARYKLPYIQLLRKKYKKLLKYKIGYCFSLLRHLKQQQKLIYSALHRWHKDFTNLMIHLRLHEKLLRIDVDIKDLCFYIRQLNYAAKLEDKPDYYDDEPEPSTPMEGVYGPKTKLPSTSSTYQPPPGFPQHG